MGNKTIYTNQTLTCFHFFTKKSNNKTKNKAKQKQKTKKQKQNTKKIKLKINNKKIK